MLIQILVRRYRVLYFPKLSNRLTRQTKYKMQRRLRVVFFLFFSSLIPINAMFSILPIVTLYHIRRKKTVWYNKIYPSFF